VRRRSRMLDELYQPALVARAGAGNVGLIMRTRWPYRSVAPNSEDDLAVKSHYGRASVWAPVRAPLKRHRQRPRAQKEEADRNTCCRGIHRSSHDHTESNPMRSASTATCRMVSGEAPLPATGRCTPNFIAVIPRLCRRSLVQADLVNRQFSSAAPPARLGAARAAHRTRLSLVL
jgi:hypothetical protein